MKRSYSATLLCAGLCLAGLTASHAPAATLGTVVPIRGQVSDLAVDSARRLVYAANFGASRIEVLNMDSLALQAWINIANQPTSLAISPDGQWLVVGHYANPSGQAALTVVNLNLPAQQRVLSLGTASVLTVAFGNSPQALVVQTSGVGLLDPVTMTLKPLVLSNFTSTTLQVPWGTFSPSIIRASSGVSGDGNVIYALVDGGPQSELISFSVTTGALILVGNVSSPQLGPRSVSVDRTGQTFLAGWVLLDSNINQLAQFPYAPGILNQGGHVFDWSQNTIYAQVTAGAVQTTGGAPATVGSASGAPLLHVLDSDNLTVRELLQLPENIAGKAVLNGNNMYTVSDSGVMVLPVKALSGVHRVKAVQESLLFTGSGCEQGVLSQYLDIVDPGGGSTSFILNVNSPGIHLSQTAGVTPARIQVLVDPVAFQTTKGTATVSLQVVSPQAVNVPAPVQLQINTRDPDQRGTIYNAPGTIVDVLADPLRNRFYLVRQDQNQVLVYEGATDGGDGFAQIGTLRTGNTPVQMAIWQDRLLVTNDNSQLINVYDLQNLAALAPIPFVSANYPRSIAVSNNGILVTARPVGGTAEVYNLNFSPALNYGFLTPVQTGIFTNKIDPAAALVSTPAGTAVFMVMPDGTVALYDTAAKTFVVSRKDVGGLSGAYGALSENQFLAGNTVFNAALVPMGQVNLGGGVSSGVLVSGGQGLLTVAPASGRSGLVERFTLDTLAPVSPMRTTEPEMVVSTLTKTPVGQVGQTILPFTRTLAPLATGAGFVQLSTSGFMIIPWDFDIQSQPPVMTSITNAVDPAAPLSPGAMMAIWGSGFTAAPATGSTAPLPKGLGGVCVYANAVPLPLYYVSPTQINALLPYTLPPTTVVSLSGASGLASPYNVNIQTAGPVVFKTANGVPLIIRTVDGKQITDATPIHLNEILNIFMTGLGSVTPPFEAGNVAPAKPLVSTTLTPQVYIGGTQLFTLWSGLAPGQIGVYQVNVQVPFHNVPTGNAIPFTIIQGGVQTQLKLKVSQ